MNVISGKKRESSPFRHVVEGLMHPYPVRSGNIRFPAITNHQRFAHLGLSGGQGKIKDFGAGLQHSEVFRKNHLLEISHPRLPNASYAIAVHESR